MKNIIAFVTLFYPSEKNVQNIRLITEQVQTVILIDNTPNSDNSALFSHIARTHYFANKENLGLSLAFNKYLSLDMVKKSDYIIFFDQDTTIPQDLVKTLAADFERLREKYNVGCIGPVFYETNAKTLSMPSKYSVACESHYFSVPDTITSSLLTTYENLKSIGFWNAHFFLDYADLELCWRFCAHHFKVFVSQNVQITHKIGVGIKNVYLPIKKKYVPIVFDAPFRLYYQMRERIKLLRLPYCPSFIKKNAILLSIEQVMVLMRLPLRQKRIFYWCKGIIDGLCNIDGALPR